MAFAAGSNGPILYAIDPWSPSARRQFLDERKSARLAKIASIARFKKGDQIYHGSGIAEAAFSLKSGVVTTYVSSPSGGQHITAFLYPGDIFGLCEQGRYTNCAKAATSVVAYRLPIAALQRLLSEDADLDLDVIVKLCEEVRHAQHHALILSQRRAVSRLAMFLDLQERLQAINGEIASEIFLPMDRTEIADFIGLSLAAVSRAFSALIARRTITCRDRRHVRIDDRADLESSMRWNEAHLLRKSTDRLGVSDRRGP